MPLPNTITGFARQNRVVNVQASSAPQRGSRKVLHAMRHGTTEMNVYLASNPYGSPGFKDPLMYDTRLTNGGKAGAIAAAFKARMLRPKPEVLVVSPLTRALQTASLAYGEDHGIPVVVEPLARERVWLSSDVGRHPSELRKDFPSPIYSFDHLSDVWWYNAGHPDPKHVQLEPEGLFSDRISTLKDWLLSRPEDVIGLVAHWGVLNELTGFDFDNCELITFSLESDGTLKVFKQL